MLGLTTVSHVISQMELNASVDAKKKKKKKKDKAIRQ